MRVTWHVCAWYTYFEEIFLDLKNKTKNQRESIKYIEHIEHVYSDMLVECKWAIAGNICEHFLQQVFSNTDIKHVLYLRLKVDPLDLRGSSLMIVLKEYTAPDDSTIYFAHPKPYQED